MSKKINWVKLGLGVGLTVLAPEILIGELVIAQELGVLK